MFIKIILQEQDIHAESKNKPTSTLTLEDFYLDKKYAQIADLIVYQPAIGRQVLIKDNYEQKSKE